MKNKGFTLIEVLISIVILSIITIITSSFLQSSIQSRSDVSIKSKQVLEMNLLSTTLRSDFYNAINTPLFDFQGRPVEATFYGELGSGGFEFVTIPHSEGAPIKVQYLFEDGSFVRRQFYAQHPANPEAFISTVLMKNIEFAQFEFSDGNNWHLSWPQNETTSKDIPKLLKIYLEKEADLNFTWIIPYNLTQKYE